VREADSMQLIVSASGDMRCLYGEEIPLAVLGSLSIVRASYVEPDGDGKWFADLSPVGGPRLGPYEHRSRALEEERQWLQKQWLPSPYDTSSGLGHGLTIVCSSDASSG
jgi:hypothetical protein